MVEGVEEIGTHRGIVVGRIHEVAPETDETYGYEILSLAGWLEESAFSLSVLAIDKFLGPRTLFSFSVGSPSRTNPVSGSATWEGGMLGVSVPTHTIGDLYGGDATVTVDLDDATANVLFDNILENGDVPYPDLAWNDVPLAGGTFRRDTREVGGSILLPELEGSLIEGRFYGATHGEVGGIFRDPPKCSGPSALRASRKNREPRPCHRPGLNPCAVPRTTARTTFGGLPASGGIHPRCRW